MESYLLNNTFFDVLISNIPQSLLVTDENRNVLIANQQFCDMFSFPASPEKLKGRSGIEVLGQLSNQLEHFVDEANIIDKIAAEKKARYNDIMKMADGRILIRDYVPIKLKQQLLGNIWLFRDETEKIQSQEVIKQQKFFYEDILNNIPADIAVFSPDHRYLFLNPVAVRDEELRKWLIGKTDIDYCILRGKDMSIAEKRRSIFKKVVESRKELEWEETIVNREKQVEHHLRKMSPIYDEQGKVKLLIGYGINITEIKKIQDLISISEKRHRDLFNYSQAIICTHDMEGKFLTVNPALCNVMEYAEEEVTGKSLKDFMLPEDKDAFDELYLSALESNKKIRGLFRVVNKSGKKVYLLYQNYCVEEPGAEKYVIAFAQDVTDRIKVEKQLKEAKKITEESAKAKERFLANMSHEIRTPMNGILGLTTLLQKTELNEEQTGYLKVIQDSAQNLLTIINDILDLEKIGSGSIQLEKINFNLNERLEMVVKFFQHAAKEKDLLLKLECNIPDQTHVIGDPTRFTQIMNNLISNAVKFTHQGSVVVKAHIESQTNNEVTLHVSVKDTGIGIDEDKLVKIFNPFTQAYPETTRKYGGTGLGLAITKNLVEIQDGNIWVESHEKAGSVFHFTVKYGKSDKPELSVEKETTNSFVFSKLKGLKVLVAEDNEINQFLTKNVLRQCGCEIKIANNGREAVDELLRNEYHIILMDIQMPVLNGLEATMEIRKLADEKKRSIPIVALTANALKGEEKKYTKVGIDDFLIKPFKENDLFNIINKVVFREDAPITAVETAVAEKGSALYDLSQFSSMAKGNEAFIKNFVNVFLQSTPPIVNELKAAFRNNDGEEVSRAAHKLKSSIDTLKIKSIKDDVRVLENETASATDLQRFLPVLSKIESTLNTVHDRLKEEFSLPV
jgi:PAS domain S-box-containing protein